MWLLFQDKEKQIFATASLIIFKSFVLLYAYACAYVRFRMLYVLCVYESLLLQLLVLYAVYLLCVRHWNTKTLVIIYCKVGVGSVWLCIVGSGLNNQNHIRCSPTVLSRLKYICSHFIQIIFSKAEINFFEKKKQQQQNKASFFIWKWLAFSICTFFVP